MNGKGRGGDPWLVVQGPRHEADEKTVVVFIEVDFTESTQTFETRVIVSAEHEDRIKREAAQKAVVYLVEALKQHGIEFFRE